MVNFCAEKFVYLVFKICEYVLYSNYDFINGTRNFEYWRISYNCSSLFIHNFSLDG